MKYFKLRRGLLVACFGEYSYWYGSVTSRSSAVSIAYNKMLSRRISVLYRAQLSAWNAVSDWHPVRRR